MSLREKLRVLVVDDMSTSRGLVTQALDKIGVSKYHWESDGKAALDSLSKRPVHLVISDYEMPNMNGLDLLSSMRSNGATKNTGFILLTGRADQKTIERGKSLGMNNFLMKPFSVPDFKKTIEQVVGKL